MNVIKKGAKSTTTMLQTVCKGIIINDKNKSQQIQTKTNCQLPREKVIRFLHHYLGFTFPFTLWNKRCFTLTVDADVHGHLAAHCEQVLLQRPLQEPLVVLCGQRHLLLGRLTGFQLLPQLLKRSNLSGHGSLHRHCLSCCHWLGSQSARKPVGLRTQRLAGIII